MSWPKCFTNKGKRKQSHHMHQHCYHYYHTNQLLSKQLCAWIVAMALADLVVFHPFTFHLSTFLDFECSLKVVEIIFLSSESLVFFFFFTYGLVQLFIKPLWCLHWVKYTNPRLHVFMFVHFHQISDISDLSYVTHLIKIHLDTFGILRKIHRI